jgi:hypothetical protein
MITETRGWQLVRVEGNQRFFWTGKRWSQFVDDSRVYRSRPSAVQASRRCGYGNHDFRIEELTYEIPDGIDEMVEWLS